MGGGWVVAGGQCAARRAMCGAAGVGLLRARGAVVAGVQPTPRRGKSTQPRASERSDATPWVRPGVQRYAPGGGKSSGRRVFIGGISRPRRLFHVRIGGFHVRIGGFKRFCRCFCPLHKIGCVRHSSSKLGSALTCTIFRGASDATARNPGCRVASLACPGLGAFAPSGRALNAWHAAGGRGVR